jgi:hypothetical protein
VTAWQQDTGERVAQLETQVRAGVTGNGQPSRLGVVEQRVTSLERFRWYLGGIAAMGWRHSSVRAADRICRPGFSAASKL